MEIGSLVLNIGCGQPLTPADGFCCLANQDTIHNHVGAGSKVCDCELMFGGYVGSQRVACARGLDLLTFIQIGERDENIIFGIEL